MNELDILQLFYDEMKNRSATRDQVFLSMEEDAAAMLSQKLGQSVSVADLQKLTDICIANEWLLAGTLYQCSSFLYCFTNNIGVSTSL